MFCDDRGNEEPGWCDKSPAKEFLLSVQHDLLSFLEDFSQGRNHQSWIEGTQLWTQKDRHHDAAEEMA